MIKPHTIDVVVADMSSALKFYRTLGLDAPTDADSDPQVQIHTEGGATLGFVTEELVRKGNPDWVTPVGQRVTFACKCDDVEELDATYARVVAAGYAPVKEPWNAFWGQRYAFLQDPDGNRVDLFTPISEADEE